MEVNACGHMDLSRVVIQTLGSMPSSFKISKVFDVSMDFLITGNKTIQDENQRVIKLQQANIKLNLENDKLKERNRVLEKAMKAFVIGDKANTGG